MEELPCLPNLARREEGCRRRWVAASDDEEDGYAATENSLERVVVARRKTRRRTWRLHGGRPKMVGDGGDDDLGLPSRGKVFSVLVANRDTLSLSPVGSSGDSEIDECLYSLSDLKTVVSPYLKIDSNPNSCDNSGSEESSGGVSERLLDESEILSPSKKFDLSSKNILKIPKNGDLCHEPPPGYFTVYLEYFNFGFSLPPHALLIEIVDSLGELVDPKSLIPAGNALFKLNFDDCDKLSLAEVRACIEKNEKTPSKTPRKESPMDRGNHNSQGIPRRRNSPGPSDRVNCSGPPSKNTDTRDRRNGGRRNDADRDTRTRENANGRINPKRRREDERTVPPDTREGCHLFLEGVNHKSNAGSFWDLKDPDIGWRNGANLIGDHDRLHLLPQPTEVLTRSLASSAFQILSLAQTFQFREERSRNSGRKFDDELASLRGECKRLGEEGAKARDDFLKSQKELEEKSKKYDAMCKDMELLKGKYSHESETGETFLNSSIGKNLLRSTGEKAIECYRESTDFRDEVIQRAIVIHDEVVVDCRKELRKTQLVPEEIIMMIHPKIPEPSLARVEDDSDPPLGDLLGGLGDEEMIEALRSNF
ncbi:uncharacterized protein [Henckelia pumila]|uniref:uncharacterized protein n=1 Tax=Henckelia pumila TaxID=405737 RepID=UPI003C6DF937